MLKIHNLDKILAINSQDIEIMTFQTYPTFYEFEFEHDNIHSTTFKVHMDRHPNRNDKNSFTMKLWDGINSTPLEYGFGLRNVKDPFSLLSYLKEVIYDWDNVTNK
jgi:hypothetical protein